MQAVPKQFQQGRGMAAGPLSNNPRPVDLATQRVDALVAAADEWLATVPTIADADTAGRAADFDEQLRAAWKDADDQRAAERGPHIDAAAEVQRLWKPVLERVKVCRDLLGDKLRSWRNREQRRLNAERAEALKLAAEAAVKAENARRQAEQPKTVADVTRAQRLTEEAERAQQAAQAIPERAQVRGTLSGRATSNRREWKVTAITDLDDLYIWLREHERPALEEFCTIMANRAVRSGAREIRGTKIEQVES